MSRLLWLALAGLILVLLIAVVLLDRRQAQRGAPSLLGLSWGAPGGRAVSGPPPARPREGSRGVPRVAVIVDELGARGDVFEEVVALGRPVTVAVRPGLPLSRRIARDAARAGLEVLLQLPLEPHRAPEADPGPGALTTAMSPDEVGRRTREYLASLPGIAGVATGMGSRFTEDRARVRAVLEAVRAERLFVVDSLTTHRSQAYDLAKALGLPAARRQLFLDTDESEATIRRHLAEVERWAARRGSVVAIGHGRPLTVRLLAEALPRWEARGIMLVRVSALLDRPAAAGGS